MTVFDTFALDSWISICGAIGALIVLLHLNDLAATPELARRFRACLLVIVVLMVVRIGHWAGWGWGFTTITYIAAALLPLMALLVSEGMMRLHAPKILKRYCFWGTVVFVLLAILPTGWMISIHISALMIFQMTGLLFVALMVLLRDKGLLSDVENQSLNRVLLSFLLILPFLATDFYTPISDMFPVRLGGIAVLGLCLLTINVNRTSLPQKHIVFSMVGLCLMAGLLTWIIATITGSNGVISVQIGAMTLSAFMLLGIWQAARSLTVEDHYSIIMREISTASGSGLDAAVSLIQKGAAVSETIVLHESDLADFDSVTMQTLFAQTPVRTLKLDSNDEHLAWLFTKFEITHALCIAPKPLTLIAFNNPRLAAVDKDGFGLLALQRTAVQIAG